MDRRIVTLYLNTMEKGGGVTGLKPSLDAIPWQKDQRDYK